MRAVPRIAGAVLMSLWRRAPREVYRVYGEDQYLERGIAPAGETAALGDTTAAGQDGLTGASWASLAAEVPPASPGAVGNSSARSSRPHGGRLVGVGLLMGVSLATLVLVLSNMAHRHGVAPEPAGSGTQVAAEQAATRATGADRAQVIVHSVNRRSARAPRFSAPHVKRPIGPSERTLRHPAQTGGGLDTDSHLERAWLAALRAPGEGAPAMASVEPLPPVMVEPSVQDEFGFEQ